MRNKIGLIIIVALIVVFAFVAFKWIKHRIDYAVTDAVFVESDQMANLSFYRAQGKIIKLYKNEGDTVKKGEVIAEIDPTDYITKLKQVKHQIQALQAKKASLEEKLKKTTQKVSIKEKTAYLTKEQVKTSIKALEHQLKQIKAKIQLVKRDVERFERLAKKELIPHRKYEEAQTQLKILIQQKKATLQQIESLKLNLKKAQESIKLAEAEKLSIPEIKKNIESLQNKILALQQQKKDLENLISYTKLISPYNGKIAKKFVSEGEVVPAGKPIYAIVPDNTLYILVLLEETKLKGVKIGSKAIIHIDAYPDKEYKGEVFEINPATAAKFALVPRDVTAGEFTKVAQRIPVKIKITEGDLSVLKVGLGGKVEIKREK
ncbi:HlyD family secretion protein [Persephonella sp.]|uniref:HlyD family secretion protein n=1 Tax=Persephonella sp. TaxID=2060922 RepID=UPI002607BDC6|nr:HlyD family secretion protein [Persephonella sp.]